MTEPFRIFIGYDGKESVAYHVLAHSIMKRATIPITIAPLVQSTLRDMHIYTRERGPTESTDFSLTRFLVPYLSGYFGRSLFLDCDILCRVDIREIEAEWVRAVIKSSKQGNSSPGVLVCKHDYTPSEGTKFLGQVQTSYPRKNWSSVMYFDNDKCRTLTPEYVNSATGLQLHRFQWVEDSHIGSLPLTWNHLVGEYPYREDAKLVHFTTGGPWFPDFQNVDYAQDWFAERDSAMSIATANARV